MLFNQTFKNIKRIREVIQVLIQYGFEDIVSSTPLQTLVPAKMRLLWSRQNKSVLDYSRWERVRLATEELGPTFVKLAQILSNRPDVLPEILIAELQKLQSEVPPFEFDLAKAIIETESGQPIEDLFEYIDEVPIGSASIGQVYKAKLYTGEEVVIKVQRPDVKETIEADLVIIKEIVRLTENYLKKQGVLNPNDIVVTFEKTIRKELDYLHEARSIEQFRSLYQSNPNLYIPKPYKNLSTSHILVLEYISGCKITDVTQQAAWGIDPRDTAEKVMDIYLTQFFEYGVFHADPHPGNVLVRKDGIICLLDFGMVGRLRPNDKYAFAGIFLSMARKDARSMALNLKRLAIDGEISNFGAFEYDLNELIEDYASLGIGEMSVTDFTADFQAIIYNYRLSIPPSVFLILRALVILEGIGKVIHPQFNTFEFVKPYGKKIAREQYSWENIGHEIYYSVLDLYTFATSFPIELKYIFQKIRKGQLSIQVEHQGYRPFLQTLNFNGFRFTMALIITGLLISSSIIMTAPLAEHLATSGGIPYLSMAGFLLAGFLGVILLIATLRGPRT